MGYMDKPAPGRSRYAGAHGGGVRGDQSQARDRDRPGAARLADKPAPLAAGPSFEGRFGRMFPDLPRSEFDSAKLTVLGWAMTADPERLNPDPKNPDFFRPSATAESENDAEENSGIPAGYTYLGQFIDHDITFDPASVLQGRNDPDALVDFRSPALDLDSLYGRGPEDEPYMYEKDGKSFRLGRHLSQGFGNPPSARDLPRFKGNPPDDDRPARALIGDKRNDENVIVSQLQGVFLRFHNRLVARHPDASFEDVQKTVRWHYQWIVVNDFLPTMVGEATLRSVWPGWNRTGGDGSLPTLKFYDAVRKDAYVPVEFSTAAYRFGHSMVRPIYRLNTKLHGGKDPRHATDEETDKQNIAGRFFIFAGVQDRGLNGFNEFPSQWAIDWSLFFDIGGSKSKTGAARLQPAYKIDTSLVNPLGFLPEFSVDPFGAGGDLGIPMLQSIEKNPASPSNLAVRNLWRGNSMRLPSGQAVATALGVELLAPREMVVGKAQMKSDGVSFDDELLSEIRGKALADFVKEAPLWYYVLAESNAQWRRDVEAAGATGAEANAVPVTMGPVGGRIVVETLLGLLLADPRNAYLTADPAWRPELARADGRFEIADLVAFATQ